MQNSRGQGSDSHLDLDRAPYVLYGVKYIDPVSLAPFSGTALCLHGTPPVSPDISYVLPTSRLYEVVSLHMCVLPYIYPYAQGCDLSSTYNIDGSQYGRFIIGH